MNYEDRITELNFDTDNEEAQTEAKEIRSKLIKLSKIHFIGSIILLSISFLAFVVLVAFGFQGYGETILFSIIPLVAIMVSFVGLFMGSRYKALAQSIILEDEKKV